MAVFLSAGCPKDAGEEDRNDDGDDDERGRVDVCKADAHSMINGQRIDLSLTCFLSWATCVRLTSNEDYYFEVVSGLPECQNFEKIHMTCIKIHARPYDAIYINTKREKRLIRKRNRDRIVQSPHPARSQTS